jgi:ABC-type uncharacterized transport system permease subunit
MMPVLTEKSWPMPIPVIGIFAICLYIVSGLLLATRLWRGVESTPAAKTGILTLGLGAVILHAALLYTGILTQGGLNLGIFNAASLIGWLMALLLLLAATRQPVENLGIVLLPLAALTLGLDRLFTSPHLVHTPNPWELDAHILISVLAYSLLSIAALQAILLAIQDHHLRNRHPGGFIRVLPPLQTMEKLLFRMIGIGFVMLSLALLSGIIFLKDIFAQHLAHKTILSIIAWLVFAVLLWGRQRYGWRGRIAIRYTLSGFILLMLAYFGTKLVFELVLHRAY